MNAEASEPSITFLTDPGSFDGETLDIVGAAYQHLFRSRRLASGAELRVVDGAGRARRGTVTEIERKCAVVVLGEPLPSNEPRRSVHLVVGALKPERADWLVEKATELGVVSITFVATERTPRRYGDGRLDRLSRVAAAAVEQCRRSRLPEIRAVLPWDEALAELDGPSSAVLDGAGRPVREEISGLPEDAAVTLFVGPEGGFTADELEDLKTRGVSPWRLGGTVLRVETAAVAAAAWVLAD